MASMGITSWSVRSLRSRAHQSKRHREEICVELDLSKDLKENITETLVNVCQPHGVSSSRKLAYLNTLVKLVNTNDAQDYGYSADEIFYCLRIGLVHQEATVRAGALRAVRYMLKREQDVITINRLQYPYLVARSMDIHLRDEIERIQAVELVRRIVALAPKHLSPALVRSMISTTNGGIEEKDRLFRVFLVALLEIGILNSNLFINFGGVGTVTRSTTTGQSPTMTEAMVGVLLRLLSYPETRGYVSLLCLAAPYTELETISLERSKEDWDQKFAASKHALISVLRSYAGVIHFCHPHEKSGIKAITDILYVEDLGLRGAILELFYELLGLPLPTWTDEPDVALAAVDPKRFRNSWKLSEGFVAEEGRIILPSLKSHCPNILELHLALLVYILLECGLHRALAETIITSDTFISVRAAVLLGALLHLAHALLPSEVCDQTPPLPKLLELASTGQAQALAAVSILSRMHAMMRRRPSPSSLFMDRLLQSGAWLRPSSSQSLRRQPSLKQWLKRESPMSQQIKDSLVLSSKDALAWNWSAIRSILRSRNEDMRLSTDTEYRSFIKRLVKYYKPVSNQFSRMELATHSRMARDTTLAGCDLINFLLEIEEPEGTKFLNELFSDVAEQIIAIRIASSAHDVLFSPRHVSTTCCQKYFLFIGQLSHSMRGGEILRGFNLLEKLQDLAVTTKHECYVKLVISSLDYSREGPNRRVVTKIVQDAQLTSTRMYATQFLRVVLRARMADARFWALGLLLSRLTDKSKTVALAALDALHEACEEPEYLEIVLQKSEDQIIRNWDQWMCDLGDSGHLLKIRLYSVRSAFSSLPLAGDELEKWIKPGGFAERYTGIVECAINDSLTRRQRNENGCYPRRSNGNPFVPKDVFVPPHLIGQLVQHDIGLRLLIQRNIFQRFARVVQRFKLEYCHNTGHSKDGRSSKEENRVEDKKNDESTRLETIVDAEVTDRPEIRTPPKAETIVEIRRKLSQDDSRRTTPERSWRGELDSRDDHAFELEVRISKVKASLWALGHAGTSALGVEQLNNHAIIELIVSIAEACPYYSVRATAMHALCLIGTTRAGADKLASCNWACVRYKRGENWPVIEPSRMSMSQHSPSPVLMQRHHRSLSDGKPEFPESLVKRQRNRSESAATELDAKRFILPERGETPSPISSIHRLSQQDAEGYAKLRSLQRHRRPSFSQSSLEMYSSDGRLSLQSLSEFESSRSWIAESGLVPTPPPPRGTTSSTSSQETGDFNARYMGICLPKKLSAIFPERTPSDVMLEKVNKSKPRRCQNASTSESSVLPEEIRSIKYLRPERQNHQSQTESDSECLSPIPTIILEDRAKSSIGIESSSKLSINESDSECAGPSGISRLVLPEDRPKQRTISSSRQYASDIDEESSSEYETSDHTRLCFVCFREKSVSNDSVATEIDFRRSLDKTQREVLRCVQRLQNPVLYKQSRQTLLRLRQQYPLIFQDICLYSEVAARLANNTYRIQARRFLQELFLDASFEALLEEPLAILKMTVNAPMDKKSEDTVSSHVPIPQAAVVVSPSYKSLKASDAKVNGRLAVASDQQPDQLSVVNEENAMTIMAIESPIVNSQKLSGAGGGGGGSDSSVIRSFTSEPRRSDEKIIAEILKPEERTRASKNPERILKATGINTAISLE